MSERGTEGVLGLCSAGRAVGKGPFLRKFCSPERVVAASEKFPAAFRWALCSPLPLWLCLVPAALLKEGVK